MAHCEYCKQEIRLGPVRHRCAGRDAAEKGQAEARRSATPCSALIDWCERRGENTDAGALLPESKPDTAENSDMKPTHYCIKCGEMATLAESYHAKDYLYWCLKCMTDADGELTGNAETMLPISPDDEKLADR